jgi:DNA-binding response OmpR family regulator
LAPRLYNRVLVVDDESDTRALIYEVLADEGYEVHLCASGDEALRALRESRFDLVLADVRMPGMSGMELLVQARAIAPDTQVVIMTAYASPASVRQAWRDEAFDYLFKPFGLDELRDCVNAAVQNRTHLTPLVFQDLWVDQEAHQVWVGEREVKLSPLEYDTLVFLFLNYGCAVSRRDLLREVWKHPNPDKCKTDTVKNCIARIRTKLGDNAQEPRYILNEWGVGYRLGQR